ncbi:MAG: hypothetical protein H0U21_02800 [Acidimicrobiia bacterium]|nr:hypothetical protein [Acidimicrobiia bacterium]
MTIRPIVLPDVDSDLLAIGHQLEELLLVLGDGRLDPGDVDLDGPWAVLAGRQGLGWLLAAFDDSLALTLYGPDGRYEHEQLRAVDVDSELATTRLAPGDVGELLGDVAAECRTIGVAVVEMAARLHGMFDPAWSAGHTAPAGPPEEARASLQRVVLDDEGEAAYCGGATGLWPYCTTSIP